jgi:hypothetical protein
LINSSQTNNRTFEGCAGVTFTVAGTGGNVSTAANGKMLVLDGTTLVCAPSAAGAVEIPGGITTIKGYAFYKNTAITSVSFPASITNMSEVSIFEGCTSLESADLSASVIASLGSSTTGGITFKGCTNLATVLLPNTLTTIGPSAFYGCTALTSITLPSSLTATAFGTMAFYQSGLVSITIPSGVTVIANELFNSCANLEKVDLPGTLPASGTSIGRLSFANCTSLTTLIVRAVTPPSVFISSPYAAFTNTTGVTAVYVPDSSVTTYQESTAAPWKDFSDELFKPLSDLPE